MICWKECPELTFANLLKLVVVLHNVFVFIDVEPRGFLLEKWGGRAQWCSMGRRCCRLFSHLSIRVVE